MKILKPNLQIAIDGQVAAGKGTTSKLLANTLQILYVDTGAMYRALAYFIKQNEIDFNNEENVCQLLSNSNPKVSLDTPKGETKDGRLITVYLNDEDVSWQIRTEEISQAVSIITTYRRVRSYIVPIQKALAQSQSVVMEGRDITTVVLPDADLKIYLTASNEIRALRRYKQLLDRGEKVELNKIISDLEQRDSRDMNRAIDPLKIATDAWVLDCSNLTISQTVDLIIKKLVEKKLIQI